MLDNTTFGSSRGDRRHQTDRDALVQRVYGEFAEMPCMRLTAPQARRLFGLRPDVSQRVLTELVDDGALASDGERYRFNDAGSMPRRPLAAPHSLVRRAS